MVVPITSDKGLCGGINSTVCKYARATLSMDGAEGAHLPLRAPHRAATQQHATLAVILCQFSFQAVVGSFHVLNGLEFN